MNLIRLSFWKQTLTFRPLALTALVVLSATLGSSPVVVAQSSTSSPGQGSGSTGPSQGSGYTMQGSGSSSSGSGSSGSGSSGIAPSQGSSSKRSGSSSKTNQGSGSTAPQQPTPQQIAYYKIVTAIQNNESEINRLFSSIPIAFPEKAKLQMEKIDQLRAKNIQLKKMLETAALQVFQNNPQKNAKAGILIYQKLLQKMDPNGSELRFDPRGALEMANILIESGLDNTKKPGTIQFRDVAYQAFRASYAIQDFARAQLMLDKVVEQGTKIRPQIYKKLSTTREKWQRELKIRRLEGSTKDLPIVKFETTEGVFVVELFENNAPATVGNFVDLVEKKFYNDMPFFLVKPGEIVQTGCPNGDGSGDAGYKIPCECYREQIRHHFTGTLSMAHKGAKDTGGSQFFISHQPNQNWDGKYTAFGRVKEGMDVIYRLQTIDNTQPTPTDVAASRILKATVVSKRDHKYEATRLNQNQAGTSPETNPSVGLEQLQESTGSGG